MTQERMMQIINFDLEAGEVTKEEQLEAYVMFFKLLGVTIKNPDGTYKTIHQVFEETHNKLLNKKETNK